jgi:predicted amidophosphoribosyltransferase
MPTFKHPCPACGAYIARDVARCPFCGAVDPFVPARCPKCRAPIEDTAWVACAKCGTPLREGVAPMPGAVPAAAAPGTVPAAPAPATPAPAAPAPSGAASCSGCGAALAAGVSFCTVCGTLAG